MKNKLLRIILIFLFTITSVIAFTYNNNIVLIDFNNIKNLVHDYNIIFNVNQITLLILTFIFYKLFDSFYLTKQKEKNILFKILSLLLSFFMLFGYSFKTAGNTSLIFSSAFAVILSIIVFIGFYLVFNAIINKIYIFIKNKNFKYKETNNKVINFIFEKHSFIMPIAIMLVAWSLVIISFYPTILSPDPANQIKQYFNIPTRYVDNVPLVDPNVLITNDNPILHTFLLGSTTKLGMTLFNDAKTGMFIYSIIQISIFIFVLAYSINYLKKLKTPYYLRIIILLIYSLVPIYSFYAMTNVKDVIFSSLVLLYTIKLFDLVKNKNTGIYSIKNIIFLILLSLLITLTRNNGIYLIVLSFPFLLLVEKKQKIRLGLTIITPIALYIMFNSLLLPALHITPGNKREMLSIPFQQTARYITYYEKELTKKEIKIIDKVLDYKTLKQRYNPELSDKVKETFNNYATDKEIKSYFKVWTNGLKKHPDTYIEATMHNVYGYFYPGKTNTYVYSNYNNTKRLDDQPQFKYQYNKDLENIRFILSAWTNIFPYIPGLGLLVNIAFCVWIILILSTYLIKLNKAKYLIPLTPALSLILVCIASPANAYFRYALPYMISIPFFIAMFIYILNEKGKSV